MDRRNFFKIVSATSAGALATACGPNTDELIPLLVPEGQIVPGEEQWHPAVCGECAAGCGTLVRVMEGRRVIEQDGERVRERRAAIKKIEGNPLDPVSGGRLCARAQAVPQALYHPDRLQGPRKRSGDRGKASFMPVEWDAAIAEAAEAIGRAPASVVFLTGAQAGLRSVAIERFMMGLGAPAPVVCALDDHPVERAAAERVFGWRGVPRYDLARATHVLSVGADFLGGWVSPVFYARQFGEFRQGRSAIRGRLVHAESRMSLTAGAADRWLPLKPGTEAQLLMAIGVMLPGRERLPASIAAIFTGADVRALLDRCGLEERRVREVAAELAAAPAPLVIGGASLVHTNSVDAVAVSHWLNVMLGAMDRVIAPVDAVVAPPANHRVSEALAQAQVIVVDGSNPAYTLPRSSGVLNALQRAQTVIAFGPFVDDTAAWADLILPDHHYLESETAVAPSLAPGVSFAVSTPFVKPLHNTRAVEQTLADLAAAMGIEYAKPTARELAEPLATPELPYAEIARQGGVWLEPPAAVAVRTNAEAAAPVSAIVDADLPFSFQPYLSLQFHDGRTAHLPWMQELPDPASSAMWNVPVEIDPQTARELHIANGDRVRVESSHGSIEAPAYVNPAAIPGVVSMAIGAGHTHYTRYASNRGANPIAILAPVWEPVTGVLAMSATRVKLARVGEGNLIQYSAKDREEREHSYR